VTRTWNERGGSGVSIGAESVSPPSLERVIQTALGELARPFSVT
jgi:hypothetical protein